MADADVPGGRRSGRHGGDTGEGLTVAELIARSRAAGSDDPSRPSRRSRRAADVLDEIVGEPELAPERVLVTAPEISILGVEAPPAVRHLTVVDDVPDEFPAVEDITVAPPRKAGRNLPAAIGVGVSLGAIIVASLSIYRPSFVFIVGLAVMIGVFEIVTAISTVEARAPLVPLLAGVVAMEAAAWYRGPDGLVGALLLTVLGLTIWRLADGAAGYLRDVAAGSLVALYVPFLAGFAALMVHADDGSARIVLFILTVVCSDTGGYAAGAIFGKHPMAPTVSPKKSWEGLAGSVIAGGIEGTLMMMFCFHHAWWQGTIFGIAVVLTATLGDLGESMIKRDLGLKDMGHLLPGHGGIMDRLDSLLPCAPVAYLLMAAFLS